MNNYTLELIHIGIRNFGTVYKAIRCSDSLKVCVKISKDVLQETDRKMVENEAHVMEQVSHPNILKYIESFWHGKTFCSVMEFADGGSLQEKIDQKFDEYKILQILVQLLEGLKFLHNKRICHLNLKPKNILFVKGILKIADFSMAKVIERTMNSILSFDGTDSFMSPEMFVDGIHGMSSDIWSAGIIAYYLAAQKLPFESKDPNKLKDLILNSELPSLPTTFPNEFRGIVASMLLKNHLMRPTADNLLVSIRQNLTPFGSDSFKCILNFFSQFHFHDFIKHCQFKTYSKYHEDSFGLFSHRFRSYIWLETNKFFQISFTQSKIVLKAYLIKCPKIRFPLS
jgi:NIMA (never in mitosis gene a)-related kinase